MSATGLWESLGPVASVDWCEPNYIVTPWVAEWWNTVSSLPMVVTGLLGLWLATRGRPIELRFRAGFIGLALIGIGSAAFHGTLRAWGQALDELPMIYMSLVFVYCLRWRASTAEDAAAQRRWVSGLMLYAVGFTAAYIFLQEIFAFFILTYAAIATGICLRTFQIAYLDKASTMLRRLFWWSVVCYAGGMFVLWLPEQILFPCDHAYHQVQPHAWFHLTSCIGSYAWILFSMVDRAHEQSKTAILTSWPPFVETRPTPPLGPTPTEGPQR